MRRIKIKFTDFWPDFVPEDSLIYRLLSKHYSVELSDKPEYLFASCLGWHHVAYDNCVKIVFVGENMVPDFNWFDYALGFEHIDFEDRYLRFPLYVLYSSYQSLANDRIFTDEQLLDRDFCSFVVSATNRDPIVFKFYERLSGYKRIASGGKIFNNVGGRVKDKNEFCSKYKFNIAFENSASRGYTTEKVMEPLAVGTVPIYWGNARIADDFTPECMVKVDGEDDIDRAIDEIVRLDKDDAAYLVKCRAPCLAHPVGYFEQRLEEFLIHIVEQPQGKAIRRPAYGFQSVQRRRFKYVYHGYQTLYEAVTNVLHAIAKLQSFR